MVKNLIFCLCIIVSVSVNADAQAPVSSAQTAQLLYRKESTFGIVAHTTGWGFNYRNGKHLTGDNKRVYELEFLKVRSPKEVKVDNPSVDNPKGFYYGKLNSVFFLRGGIGFQHVIYGKDNYANAESNKGTQGEGDMLSGVNSEESSKVIEIRYLIFGGASLAFAKPIYLDIINTSLNTVTTERYDPEKHPLSYIYGKAPFSRGIEQTKIHPGLYAKMGLSFEFSPYSDGVKTLETGIVLDYFATPIPMMAYNKPLPLFLNLYLSINFGKKWF